VREQEGWKWAEAHLDFPYWAGLARVYPHPVERSEAEATHMTKLSEEYDALVSQWDAVEDLPPDIEARFGEIDAALEAYGEGVAYDPDDLARGGVFVVLGNDGTARIERGFIRPEDMPVVEPQPDKPEEAEAEEPDPDAEAEAEGEPDGDPAAPLPDRLVLDLTAQRTAALRDALGASPEVALSAVVHALAAATFYLASERTGCLELKPTSVFLQSHAADIGETRASLSIAERHERWAVRLPKGADDLWAFVQGLLASERLELLAHCASLTVNAVHVPWDKRPRAWAMADRLAEAVDLDMAAYWSPTVASYLGRVTKAKIAEAVREGVSDEAAARISGLKKPEMASEAQALLAGTGWLPSLLRKTQAPQETVSGVTPVSQDAA
jgi:ParB family chromosome partitioning protein